METLMIKMISLMALVIVNSAFADDAKLVVDCQQVGNDAHTSSLQILQAPTGEYRYVAFDCVSKRFGCENIDLCNESSGPISLTGTSYSTGSVQIHPECGQTYVFDDTTKNLEITFFNNSCKFSE